MFRTSISSAASPTYDPPKRGDISFMHASFSSSLVRQPYLPFLLPRLNRLLKSIDTPCTALDVCARGVPGSFGRTWWQLAALFAAAQTLELGTNSRKAECEAYTDTTASPSAASRIAQFQNWLAQHGGDMSAVAVAPTAEVCTRFQFSNTVHALFCVLEGRHLIGAVSKPGDNV